MSTKVPENCPKCVTPTTPIDSVKVVAGLPLKLWRYYCGVCDWTWANPLQREHNDREHTRIWKSIQGGWMYD